LVHLINLREQINKKWHAMKPTKNNERSLQAIIVKALNLLGFIVIHIPNQYSRGRVRDAGVVSGAPDLIVLKEGKVFFLEVKTKTGRVRPSQKLFAERVRSHGFDYHLVRSLDDALKAVGYG
jgi:predicted type IV restriction endonuclease